MTKKVQVNSITRSGKGATAYQNEASCTNTQVRYRNHDDGSIGMMGI